ncbi:MAG: hypothetical protein QW197_01375 [Candidatus Aenigmatarchaeota archaeon]
MKLISFSLDIVLSLIIFSFALIIFNYYLFSGNVGFKNIEIYQSQPQTKNYASEILNSLINTKLKEVLYLNFSFNVDENDLEKSLAEIISSLYVSGIYSNNQTLKNYAKEIAEKFLNEISKNYCIELRIVNESIYKNCNNYSSIVQSDSAFISGLEYGKPIKGYIARAWLTQYRKNTTKIIDFIISGSGWKVIANNGGDFEYYKNFYIDPDIKIYNATLFFSMHVGNIRTETALFKRVSINNCELRNSVLNNIIYSQCEGTSTETNCAIFSIIDVTNCIKNGNNEIVIVAGAPQSYHAHIHPGFKLSLFINVPESLKEGSKEFKQRIYFDRIVGRTGAWLIMPFFIPENAIFYNASLYLKVLNVEDSYIKNVNTSDIIIFLNSKNPIYKDGNDSIDVWYPQTPYYCNNIDYRNYYCNRYFASSKNINITMNITQYLIKGTNTLSIYINSFGDFHWGKDFAEISNESYIDIYYILNESNLKYGEIEISKEIIFGGKPENPKTYYYNRSEEKISSAFIHLVQGFSSMINASINNISFYLSPSPRAVPSHFYLYPNLIKFGNNTIRLTDIQPSGSISPSNYILPWTSLEINYIVKGLVGYGNVFENQSLAIEDAIKRLKNQIGNIEISNVQIDTEDVYGIRWLFGPEILKIIVWPKD